MGFVYFVWFLQQTANFALRDIKRLVFITNVESVFTAGYARSPYITQIGFVFNGLM
jgi:hypothetical protein